VADDDMVMISSRTALVAAALTLAVVPATAAAAAPADEAQVRDLANAAAEAVAEEQQLLGDVAPSGQLAGDPDARARLRTVDSQGALLLSQLEVLGVDVSDAVRVALARLPQPGTIPPPAVVYDAAFADLARMAATPAAVLPAEPTTDGPAIGLLAVAAVALLALGAAALGNALRRQESEDDLAAMAWSDGLTGLANRRRLDHDVAAFDMSEAPTAAIMIDIDHFKSVNDAFGHQQGDEVICTVAEVLLEHVRFDDVVYRYGGEEFCILLPGADADDARGVAQRIVEAARQVPLPDGSHVTVSVGVASGDQIASTAVESADQALLSAKASGRDCAVEAPVGTADLVPA
jgi:diguanylate cyclase (GGDEF)-like protein